jgi:Domain of unknown function (DUF929)
MVDWDRVDELRGKGWDWERIAADPKVGFHPDASAGRPGRALRALYHRARRGTPSSPGRVSNPDRPGRRNLGPGWNLTRAGYLAVPFVGIWFLLAYVAPSPVGLLLPAIPWIGLALAVVAFVLIYALWRTSGAKRWSPLLRSTLVSGIVLGLMFSGVVGLVGAFAYGCPYLPPAASLSSTPAPGWATGHLPSWTQNGKPVLYFYGATWCPYCSASSWAIWKALIEFGTVSGNYTSHSSLTDVYAGTPEMVLASTTLSSPHIAFQVSEYSGTTDGDTPATSSCREQAYLTAYSAGSIPFLVIGGTYVHGGNTLIDPTGLADYTVENDSSNGPATVEQFVHDETNSPAWTAVQGAAWWIMAILIKVMGGNDATVSTLATQVSPSWTASTQANVTKDLNQLL